MVGFCKHGDVSSDYIKAAHFFKYASNCKLSKEENASA
jgi:hypothetical protein